MNVPSNLALYGQLIVFKNDQTKQDINWHFPDNQLQRSLQSLAHHLELEYEYSLATRDATISQVMTVESNGSTELEDPNAVTLDMYGGPYFTDYMDFTTDRPSINFDVGLEQPFLPALQIDGSTNNQSLVSMTVDNLIDRSPSEILEKETRDSVQDTISGFISRTKTNAKREIEASVRNSSFNASSFASSQAHVTGSSRSGSIANYLARSVSKASNHSTSNVSTGASSGYQ